MLDELLPEYRDVDALTDREQRAIMPVLADRRYGSIESFLRRVFVWAAVSCSSDVHIEGHGDRERPDVHIHVRTPKGIVNLEYQGEYGKHFETKMFTLTNTPQGASTPQTMSMRFSMALPGHYARKHGLIPRDSDGAYEIDMRVEYCKTFDSFSFVARLLDQQRTPSLDGLNLSSMMLHQIRSAALEPSGLIIASGPTGSGKTTLLNAVLSFLNDDLRSITTIENPVEFRLRGKGPIKQLQVQGDLTFARALRALMRMDPELILVGEIRDQETAKIAVEASRTGHLVLSTLHANTAHETITRLVDMSGDHNAVADTLKLVLAQRLLDRYVGVPERRPLNSDEASWMKLNGMGHITHINEVVHGEKKGKAAIIEAIRPDPQIKELIRSGNVDSTLIYRLAKEQDQYESLASAGVRAVESFGCKLSECEIKLESNTDAQLHPGRRIRLAKEKGISLTQVGEAFDERVTARNAEAPESLDALLDKKRQGVL